MNELKFYHHVKPNVFKNPGMSYFQEPYDIMPQCSRRVVIIARLHFILMLRIIGIGRNFTGTTLTLADVP